MQSNIYITLNFVSINKIHFEEFLLTMTTMLDSCVATDDQLFVD